MLLSMMKQIDDPRIGICLDVGHANAMTSDDIPVEEWIRVLAPYIGHVHLHNNDGKNDLHQAFGLGVMDMDSIFAAIEAHCSPETTFTIEAHDCESCASWLKEHGYI